MPASRHGQLFGFTRGKTVHTLIRRARRRLISNDLFARGAVAASAALAAFILLLVLGAQVLDWRWLLAVPSFAFGWGLVTVLKRRPAPYRVAQVLDHRLDLKDSLSTALYYSDHPGDTPEEVRQWQYRQAERMASGADVCRAIPFLMPRGAYAVAALLVVAFSLFALRYGVSHRLDLKPPLAAMLRQKFGWEDERTQDAKQARRQPPKGSRNQNSPLAGDEDLRAGEPDPMAERVEEVPDPGTQDKAANTSKKDGKRPSDDEIAGDSDQNSKADDLENEEDDQSDNAAPPNKQQDQKGKAAPKRPPDSQYSSLLAKLQDAMKNLLSKFNLEPPTTSSDEEGSTTQSRKTTKGKGREGGEKASGKGSQKQASGEKGDPQAGEGSDESMAAQNTQAKGNSQSDSEQNGSKQPGSGIGTQDGAKDLKQAQQLDAMNKISEIIGKRSATVTGEATVEVHSTSQELQTPYAQKHAQHTEAGAEIGRDEVPVALQSYVQQYFEQVRKPAPAK